ncbi:copper resistance protein NlpE N-terminal domain-containing protein [Chitinophagaceae bacterium LB-8]|uniref:Copper resistance protein NlpE N-terminal domain-containing protein n=1 Tax=Paraflavisolibacter caeni TaxID=2982496 RepID=A0A9X2XUL4_9BACT|nr:copper resistance protein NlpE N-terminal domain-containing protein [Paraflavisolibacter caeni]MCU7548028.1 copper resistance protein NlpE N-terminal domain-containing protein [Paraflavisolibacter caeni]
MKKLLFASIFISFIIGFYTCKTPSTTTKNMASTKSDNSRNSLDWDGIYRGVLPCADCQGIQTTVYLNKDLSYRLKLKYLGKSDSAHEYSGKFSWNNEGSTITLDGQEKSSYFVGENTLTQLDKNGNKISGGLAGKYILSKEYYALLEKYWKLTELYGQPVSVDSTYRKEPHIIFKDEENRFIGIGGCNSISGTYDLGSGNRILLSKVISTRMALSGFGSRNQILASPASSG